MIHRFFVRPLLRMICVVAALSLSTQAMARSEVEIQALYLYNFIKFTEWPDEANQDTFGICILGESPFGALTEKLNTLKARGKPVRVIESRDLIDLRDSSAQSDTPYSQCTLLFISTSEENFYQNALSKLMTAPVLTVSKIDGFVEQGGMIGFSKAGNVVRFEVNLKRAQDVGLKISSKLLKLAHKVEQ